MHIYCSRQHLNLQNHRFCTHCGEPLPLPEKEVIVNRYRIVRQLGHGGFGRTYLAEDLQEMGSQCVLKEFAPQVEEPKDLEKAKELFEREVKVLQQLKHPQIPRFHSCLKPKMGIKDFFFLVQDYVEGSTYYDLLDKRLDEGYGFSETEVIELLKKILPVLSYIHGKNVIHRDISPDNLILRSKDNLPVLIDFGAVKQLPASKGFWFTKLPENRTLLGKKGYAPEEQLRQGKAFPSSDLYSLAVSALVLLTGKEPQKLYDGYNGKWRWQEEIKVSIKLESILSRMLAFKPSDRYQYADAVLKDLQNLPAPGKANSRFTKINTMVVSPGKRVGAVASRLHQKTQAISQSLPIPVWLRPFAVSMITTTIIVGSLAGTWALVSTAIGAVSSIKLPSVSLPSLPKLPSLPGKGGSTDNNKANPQNNKRIIQIINRRQRLEISEGFFNRLVNQDFYTQNPQAKGRSLTGSPEDKALRNKWFDSAQNVLQKLEQAKLTSASRRKLGSYSGSDYQRWRQQIQSGTIKNYSIDKLTDDTNRQFYRLFPNQPREKLDQQTFGQIWYAMAADHFNKRL
ncbi:MAG: serine/threonine-protein kinase [Cyanobacteria bacterium P01_A01_bin.84]